MFEHSTDPARTLADMVGFLTESGFILLSTLFQPSDIDRQGLNWWYASPRNAHISLYTKTSLERLVQPLGFRFVLLDQSLSCGLSRATRLCATHRQIVQLARLSRARQSGV